MQLPRGTFHSIKRGIVLHSLLDEMEKSKFTGYCTIRYDVINCTIVLQSGNYLLADYEKLEGEPAWQKIHNLLTKKVDAALTTLNDPQIKLCIEFNTHAELPETVRRSHRKTLRAATPAVRSGALGSPEPAQGSIPVKEHHVASGQVPHKPVHEGKITPQQAHLTLDLSQRKQDEDREATETIDRELNSLEDMDLDEMAKKIRESCKITVERLNLEHLIQKMSD
jgi:hypothetical protein